MPILGQLSHFSAQIFWVSSRDDCPADSRRSAAGIQILQSIPDYGLVRKLFSAGEVGWLCTAVYECHYPLGGAWRASLASFGVSIYSFVAAISISDEKDFTKSDNQACQSYGAVPGWQAHFQLEWTVEAG